MNKQYICINLVINKKQKMHQQLIEQTIEITPQTMHDVLPKLVHAIAQPNQTEKTLEVIVKSIFYGLWNFDKMINQHNLSTEISQILTKVPKKNAFIFLHAILNYLKQKWNFIDHHRINKFMQLTRYLIKQGIKVSHKKTDQALEQTIFSNIEHQYGIVDHVIEIYFDTVCEIYQAKSETHKNNQILAYQKFQIFERLMLRPDSTEYLREHIIEKIYEKYKNNLVHLGEDENGVSADHILEKIQEFNNHILQIAKNQENDANRKSLYTLVGFMKSDHNLFSIYISEKKQKSELQREKKKKKITKFKKELIRESKKKRKQKNKANKKGKIISRSKFQFKARQQLQKVME